MCGHAGVHARLQEARDEKASLQFCRREAKPPLEPQETVSRRKLHSNADAPLFCCKFYVPNFTKLVHTAR